MRGFARVVRHSIHIRAFAFISAIRREGDRRCVSDCIGFDDVDCKLWVPTVRNVDAEWGGRRGGRWERIEYRFDDIFRRVLRKSTGELEVRLGLRTGAYAPPDVGTGGSRSLMKERGDVACI
jgi:hypothetical protein